MSTYLRPKVAGATIFFRVNLAHRGTTLLAERVDLLREAVRQTKAERPFGIEASVVLPDHLHCIWTLPVGASGYSVRWGAIKSRFSMAVLRAGFTPPYPSIFNAEINASCGISTLPNWRIFFLPAFCLSKSLRFRVASPP